MTLLPISLGVRRASDTKGTASKVRPTSKDQIEKTLWRDGFACRCCGFVSKKYQRVMPLETVGRETGEDSLITVCTFCEMCASLDRAGMAGGALLIWLPELSQAELHHVVRALYVAMKEGGSLAPLAAQTLDVLKNRRLEAKKRLGTEDPLVLATAMQESVEDTAYKNRAVKMDGIRLLPPDRYFVRQAAGEADVFPQMISYWTSPEGPFGKTPVSEWAAMFENISSRVADK